MERNNLIKKGLVVAVILLFFSVSVISSTGNIVELEKSYVNLLYTPHDPIYINGNDNFTSENGVTGGIGTSYNPYVIKDWEINASSQHGITIRNVNMYFTIRGCYVHAGGTNKDGIVFKNVTNGKIEDTIIKDNRYGIIFRQQDYPWQEHSSYNIIQNNTVTDNTKDGIHFEHTMTGHHSHNLIFLNNITKNNNRGIYMIMSRENLIFANNIMSNSNYGVELYMCTGGGADNKVYHNNIINNGDENGQATTTGDNDWDDGYPSGGNFWSDYDGVDDYSGPNQNIPGSDGIGDTPYIIGNYWDFDYYPLMEPYGNWTLPPIAKFTWTPSLPDPGETILFNASESFDCDGNITLYEWDWDNDGEYDENHTNHTATHSWLEYGYYPVTLRITDNDNLTDSKTKTVRVGNLPPNEPSLPVPFDGATDVSIVVHLSWVCGDPDGDDVAYDVYFGNTTPPPKVAGNITHDYNPGILDYNTTYYWQIVAWDNWGASTAGSIWSFTTIPARLGVVIVKPVEKSFYLRNTLFFPLPRNTIIVGYIDICVNATSDAGIEKVEFYINNKLKMIDFEEPYRYRWNSLIPFRYVIKAVAYGIDGNWTSEEMKVWKFF